MKSMCISAIEPFKDRYKHYAGARARLGRFPVSDFVNENEKQLRSNSKRELFVIIKQFRSKQPRSSCAIVNNYSSLVV